MLRRGGRLEGWGGTENREEANDVGAAGRLPGQEQQRGARLLLGLAVLLDPFSSASEGP